MMTTDTKTGKTPKINLVINNAVAPVATKQVNGAECIDISPETFALLQTRAQWSAKLNEASAAIRGIDKDLEAGGFPTFEGTARTVLMRCAKKIVGAIVVKFRAGYEVKPTWTNTKQLY